VLLALPVALGLGPWAGLAGGALAVFLHLSRRERLVVSASLLLLTLLPWGAEAAGRLTAWTGSMAEEVFELEHGADGGERAARLAARPDLPAPALLAVGRFHKRRGRLDEAMRWYERAAEKGGRTPELLVAMGNVLMLRGDAERAKTAWLEASDRADGGTALAAAQYNLSKLYLRSSALEQSQQARRRAQQVDGAFLARSGSDDDFRANRWILDAPLEHEQIRELAGADGPAGLAREAVRARLAGAIPPGLWPWAPLGAVAFLWLLLPLGARLRPSSRCERCGRPSCLRCDAQAGPLCGQCVNVFQKKGVVDPRDRARKEAQVRRHDEVERWTPRALALAGGGAGHLWLGEAVLGFLVVAGLSFAAFVVVFWRGLIPPPHPSPYLLFGKLAVAVPLGLLLYALAVRDAFRRTRS
jgi:tetratricopeptide (TPR) repeat protein